MDHIDPPNENTYQIGVQYPGRDDDDTMIDGGSLRTTKFPYLPTSLKSLVVDLHGVAVG